MYSHADLQKKAHQDTSQSPDHTSDEGNMPKSLAPLEKQKTNRRFTVWSTSRGWIHKNAPGILGRRDKSCPKHSPVRKEQMVPTPMWDRNKWTMVLGKSAAPTRWQNKVTLDEIEVRQILMRASEFRMEWCHELGQPEIVLGVEECRHTERSKNGK